MSDLLSLLRDLEPASLWTVAPRDLLMRAAGLVATGEISDWSWTGPGQLEVEFPRRLDMLVCRLRLLGEGGITSACDCKMPAPCQHHLATLMLVTHLLKDFNAFGRFPNRKLAEMLKVKLLGMEFRGARHEASRREPVKNLLLRPAAHQVFAYRLALGPTAPAVTATVPRELQPLISTWTYTESIERQFWDWFTTPGITLPVYLQAGNEELLVKAPRAGETVTSAIRFTIRDDGVRLSRQLERDNVPVTEPALAIGYRLLFLMESRTLLRLPVDPVWAEMKEVVSRLHYLRGSHPRSRSDGLVDDGVEAALEEWNALGFHWPESLEEDLLPELWWKGQRMTGPVTCEAAAHIALSSDAGGELAVELSVQAGGVRIGHLLHELALAGDIMDRICPDPQFMQAKGRRAAVLTALYKCWLEPSKKARQAILKELAASSVFKSRHAGRMAERLVKDLQDGPPPEEDFRAPGKKAKEQILFASPEQGWVLVPNHQRVVCEAMALVRYVLGAEDRDSMEHYYPESRDSATFYISAQAAFERLPVLVAECKKRGVSLTFNAQAIATSALQLRVKAGESDALDWFELKPEVWCDGSLIPQDRWEQILLHGHYVDETGVVKVIDVTSAQGLQRMSRLIQSHRTGSRKEDKEEVKVPRLRILDWLELRKHGVEYEIPEAQREVLESLLNFDQLKRAPLPKLNATLREYQHDGYSWLAFHYRHGFGSCLADDMGLGKTLQTITLLAARKEGLVTGPGAASAEPAPHLLVVPPTLLFNWQNEIKTFYPQLYVHQYTGAGRSLIGIKEGVVITTYELARRDIEKLKEKHFDCIIFDEAQAVKNALGERAQAMRQLNGNFKLVLTGTPLENHAGEYFSILDLALPGLLGDRKEFLALLKDPDPVFNPLNRARPFVLRRTKEKILKELPPKVESDIHLELTDEQKKFYTRAVAEVREEVMAAFADKTAQQAGIVALAALTRLRQICVSPALIDPEYKECSPKLGYLCGKLEELRDEGHSALVFSQFTKALDRLELELKAADIPYQRLDGSTPQEKRKKLVEAYQNGTGPSVFLISLRAGGAGLNLTRASYVFHLDPWWNPAVENQASDRAHRMGQKSTVFIQRLLMLHTVEEKIMQLKAKKSALFEQVINGSSVDGSTGGSLMTKDDFRFLLE